MEIYRNTNPEVPFIAENNMVEPYVCVELGAGDQEVDLPNAVTDTVVGVAQHSASAGEAVNVQVTGITLITAGGAVTKGARLHITGSGWTRSF
jgi:hypothetical protein